MVIDKLVNKFNRLGGVGKKTATRYAYAVIDMPLDEVKEFADALIDVKTKVKFCEKCFNFTENDICDVCAKRNNKVICVVTSPKDVLAIEKIGAFKGVYHVLHGTISPLDGRGPNDIKIKELLKRLTDAEEVILATNTDVEGEATAMYIANLLRPLNIKTSRIAQGVSSGSDIEFIDEVTLIKAMDNRVDY